MEPSNDPSDARAAWNQVSARYQERQAIPTHSAHYGPWAPTEEELRLLGDVRGLRILEIGCGGGQTSIALARAGAVVAGLDLSDAQLALARRLAAEAGVRVAFQQGRADDLSAYASAAWDLVFSAYAFPYVEQMPRALAECARVLVPGGRLVFCQDHPLRACFFDAADEEDTVYPSRNYFDRSPMRWHFADTGVAMVSYHRTLADWIGLLAEAGFTLRRLLEPEPPTGQLDDVWPADGALAPLRLLPQAIIFVAERSR